MQATLFLENRVMKYLLIPIFIFLSCTVRNNLSTTQIDSGQYISRENSSNTVPGVFFIGNCTATAVSSSTVITAAHCVSDDGVNISTSQMCRKSQGSGYQKCTNKIFIPPKYAGEDFTYDVAVAVFEPGTFAEYFALRSWPIASGEPAVFVGYSSDEASDFELEKNGSKRWGRNLIREITSNHEIKTYYGGNMNEVAVSPGGSGGPLFTECYLAGVASRMSSGTANKYSVHTDLTYSENLNWLASLQDNKGAYFCGAGGNDPKYCDPKGLSIAVNDPPKNLDGTEGFPCQQTDTSSQPPQINFFAGLSENDSTTGKANLFISLNQNLSSVKLCPTDENCLSNVIEFKNQGTFNNLSYFKLENIDLSNLANRILFLQLEQNGNKILKKMKIRNKS